MNDGLKPTRPGNSGIVTRDQSVITKLISTTTGIPHRQTSPTEWKKCHFFTIMNLEL